MYGEWKNPGKPSKDKDVKSMSRMAKIRRERMKENAPQQGNKSQELQSAIIQRLARGRS